MSITLSRTGAIITVHSDALDLTTIIGINLGYVGDDGYLYNVFMPKTEFLTQTATDITFTLPDTCRFIATLISITFTGTTFTGTTALGSLSVLLADASGMYAFTVGKTNDTLYLAASIGPDTEDVAIPDPEFKTGFIGG